MFRGWAYRVSLSDMLWDDATVVEVVEKFLLSLSHPGWA